MKPARHWLVSVLGAAVMALYILQPAAARDLGQWENQDPRIRAWYRSLMQPDNPGVPCCGEADAYWCDAIHVTKDGVTCTITDDRPDAPLGRPHVPVGTVIAIPPHKYKFDRGNPTGHTIVFLSQDQHVYCFVQGSGT